MSDSLYDPKRLSMDQMNKISEFQNRLMKQDNPAAKLFDDITYKKIVEKDKGYARLALLNTLAYSCLFVVCLIINLDTRQRKIHRLS